VNAVLPEVNALPALSNGHFTFGSFNRPAKAGDNVLELWSRVLQAVPGSRFLVGAMTSQKLEDRTAERFARFGIGRERLIFRPHSQYYLSFHNEVDLLLDTFPYAGGTTTALALGMGVPTLTLAGRSFASRVGMCFLQDVDLPEFVAHTPEHYVGKAVEWSRRLDELAAIRAGLRERAEGKLRHSERAIRGFDAAFMTMWRRWCAGLAAESFEVKLDE
jgi:predicted O-linked N-acetylglucosamine transferase (SPINDLY family)